MFLCHLFVLDLLLPTPAFILALRHHVLHKSCACRLAFGLNSLNTGHQFILPTSPRGSVIGKTYTFLYFLSSPPPLLTFAHSVLVSITPDPHINTPSPKASYWRFHFSSLPSCALSPRLTDKTTSRANASSFILPFHKFARFPRRLLTFTDRIAFRCRLKRPSSARSWSFCESGLGPHPPQTHTHRPNGS
jgi:hypothetical protein